MTTPIRTRAVPLALVLTLTGSAAEPAAAALDANPRGGASGHRQGHQPS